MTATDDAIDFGLDLSLVEESLKLTPEQRAIEHQRALEMALQLQSAFDARQVGTIDDRAQPTAANALRR